ncbi:hypothetical protein [uncultured Dysosmobacter sp.]|uniref:hypothetical protein n=1 Tax=uncultured Dysosmobacter sp. TaxID=2591384 RepID=UPI002622B6E2|nr:hypothetical protein [uncultured Dysosmobacter sp.]
MGFFQRIGNALARFMYGRNGMDQLNRALFWSYLAIFLVQAIVAPLLKSRPLALACDALLWILMLLIFFRMFSKNLPKRRAENQKWMSWWWGVKNRQAGAKARHADKDHRYFTCKNCKTICRVPVGKGKIVITCPKCGAEIKAKT